MPGKVRSPRPFYTGMLTPPSIPLTQTGSRPSSVERSPSVQSTYLQSSPVPAIQLTPPLSADPWHSHHLHSKGASNRISVTSSVLTKAINSTRQRPHKWAHVLIFLTCLVLTLVTTFLAVLWFSNKSPLWHYIMEHNYATRFITGSTLVVRIMVDLQACVAATMLAALFLESRDGVALAESVAISIMRYDTTPLTLALPVLRGWGQQRKRIAYGLLSALLLCLVATTMLLQLSSTILLMDLSIGSHPGLRHTRYLPLDFSYRCLSEHCNEVYLNQIPRISSWGMGPPSFPAFAELKSEADRSNPEIADTGVLLRAFPPYTDANTRENLQEYIGKALVIDARVSCQAPKIEDLVWTSPTYANFSGRITSRIPAPRLTEVAGTNFSCTYGNLNHLSLCQISNNPFQPYFGSLRCQFENNSVEEKTYVYDERPTTYGTAFLVIKAINGSEVPSSDSQLSADGITELIYQDEWLNLKKPMDDGSLAALSLSLCFAPWETARLPITMKSDQNRSEPRTTWQPPESVDSAGSFDMSQVLRQHGIGSYKHASSVDRGILNLTVPSYQVTEADDRRPRSQRPFVQTDTSEIGLSFGGANVPLASNWTIFLSGNILPSILTDFSYEPANVFAADPAVTNLFVSTLEQSDVAHAMASIITVLSATSYYNQMPAFDYAANVSEILFQSVLIPLSRSGYTAFVYVLATHVVVVAIVVALFKLQTKLSLVGESWAAVAPLLAASTRNDLDLMDGDDEKTFDEIREMLIDASGIDDERVVNRLRQRGVSGHAVRLEDGELTEDGETSLIFRVVH